MERGTFICFEGIDNSGKTTQSIKLEEYLTCKGIKCSLIRFPDRNSETGKLIDSYLSNKTELDGRLIHLLFSANRYEMQSEINKLLEEGITIICDRYSGSGVAYSVAKGLDFEWCKNIENKLINPDLTIYLDINPEKALERKYDGERYEKLDFQQKVHNIYHRLMNECDRKLVIDCNELSIENIHDNVIEFMRKNMDLIY